MKAVQYFFFFLSFILLLSLIITMENISHCIALQIHYASGQTKYESIRKRIVHSIRIVGWKISFNEQIERNIGVPFESNYDD